MWWWLVACGPDEDGGCAAPDGLSSPAALEDVFDLVDALPGPTVDVPCLVSALARPLPLEATRNAISAQPAASAASPRLFLRYGVLAISVVPEGVGRPLVELSEYDPATGRSRKAELHAPIHLPLDRDLPFRRVVDEDLAEGSVCGLCHWDEVEVAPGRFASVALRPEPDTEVDLGRLQAERARCDVALEPDRCAVLSAVFDHGPVEHAPFPEDWPTLYERPPDR